MDLTFDDHRVDHRAEIVDRRPAYDLRDAGLGIDLDLADVAACREGEIGRIVEGTLLEPRLDLRGGELMRNVCGKRHLPKSHFLVGALDREGTILELDILSRSFHYMSRDLLGLGLDLVERLGDGSHADGTGARAVGAHPELNLVGVAMDDRHAIDVDA